MELSPEERQRIYLEEKARFEAQEKLKAAATSRKYAGCGTPVIAIILGIVVLIIVANVANLGDSGRKKYTVAMDWYCGDQESAMLATIAAQEKDLVTLSGLLARGKLFRVAEGTRVTTLWTPSELSVLTHVYIDSGLRAGETCYLPTKMLR